MTTLLQLRTYVRNQTQTTVGELPDSTIDTYLREAFTRTVAYENQWPWFEKTWPLTQSADEYTIPVPADCNVSAITGLVATGNRWRPRLQMMPHITAQDLYGRYVESGVEDNANYAAFSVWAKEFVLWPNSSPVEDVTYELTGFRFPVDWIAQGAAAEPDIDPRLHNALAHYAISLAYAQQEDETLESTYMQRWQNDVNTVRGAVMEPSQDRPLVFGPQRIRPIGNQRYY